MEPKSSNIHISKSLLLRQLSFEYNIEIPVDSLALRQLAATCANSLSSLAGKKRILTNLKGRDKFNTIAQDLSLPFDHELFNLDVEYDRAEVRGQATTGTLVKASNYLLSNFLGFEGDIVSHSLSEVISSEIPKQNKIESILRNPQFTVLGFRLGLDFFGYNKIANWFTRTPVVQETLLIECSEDKMALRIVSEGHSSKGAGLKLHNYNGNLEKILQEIARVLSSDLLGHIKLKLSQGQEGSRSFS